MDLAMNTKFSDRTTSEKQAKTLWQIVLAFDLQEFSNKVKEGKFRCYIMYIAV